MIVDVHTHLWDSTAHIQPFAIEDLARLHPDEPVRIQVDWDDYQTAMAVCDKVICFGLRGLRNGFAVPNEFVADLASRQPDKLIGFMALDPHEPQWHDAFTLGYQDLKLRGVKLGPIYADFDPRDPDLDWLYAQCVKYNLPILFHMGTSFIRFSPLACSRPFLIDAVAIRFPDLKIIIAHLAHPWEAETLAVIRKHPGVYSDISALFGRPWLFYNALVLAQEYGVTHKLLFGSDYPFTAPESSMAGLRDINRFCLGTALPRISKETIEGIIHRDAIQLLWGQSS